jgi:hypothetical protein
MIEPQFLPATTYARILLSKIAALIARIVTDRKLVQDLFWVVILSRDAAWNLSLCWLLGRRNSLERPQGRLQKRFFNKLPIGT